MQRKRFFIYSRLRSSQMRLRQLNPSLTQFHRRQKFLNQNQFHLLRGL